MAFVENRDFVQMMGEYDTFYNGLTASHEVIRSLVRLSTASVFVQPYNGSCDFHREWIEECDVDWCAVLREINTAKFGVSVHGRFSRVASINVVKGGVNGVEELILSDEFGNALCTLTNTGFKASLPELFVGRFDGNDVCSVCRKVVCDKIEFGRDAWRLGYTGKVAPQTCGVALLCAIGYATGTLAWNGVEYFYDVGRPVNRVTCRLDKLFYKAYVVGILSPGVFRRCVKYSSLRWRTCVEDAYEELVDRHGKEKMMQMVGYHNDAHSWHYRYGLRYFVVNDNRFFCVKGKDQLRCNEIYSTCRSLVVNFKRFLALLRTVRCHYEDDKVYVSLSSLIPYRDMLYENRPGLFRYVRAKSNLSGECAYVVGFGPEGQEVFSNTFYIVNAAIEIGRALSYDIVKLVKQLQCEIRFTHDEIDGACADAMAKDEAEEKSKVVQVVDKVAPQYERVWTEVSDEPFEESYQNDD